MNNPVPQPKSRPDSQLTIFTMQVPYSQEAEQATLGALITNPEGFLEICDSLQAEDFYLLRHSHIWEAMKRLSDRDTLIDYITLSEELRVTGHMADIGGAVYLTQLVNNAPSSSHAPVYAQIVKRAAVRRRLLQAADEIKGLAMDEALALEQIEPETETRLHKVWCGFKHHDRPAWTDVLGQVFEGISARVESGPNAPRMGIPTLHDLDELLGGLQKGDLILLAGRPSQGKTALMLSIALRDLRLGARVGLLTQEMTSAQIAERFLAIDSGVGLQRLRLGTLSKDAEWPRVVKSVGRLSGLHFEVDDARGMTPEQARAIALRWQRHRGLDLLLVDYIGLMRAPTNGNRNTASVNEEVGVISRALKELAGELDVPIMAAAQLNRGVESRADKHPVMSDLRDSGSLEQDADVVVFLYRDVVYNPATEFPHRAELIVSKHRNGPTGAVVAAFNPETTAFSDELFQRNIDLSVL